MHRQLPLNHTLLISRCIPYLPKITNCALRKYGVLPSEPRNFRFSNVGADIGLLHWDPPLTHGATVVLTGWPNMPDLRRLGVAAGVEAVLEMAGRKNVSVEFEGTADGAIYQARWDA